MDGRMGGKGFNLRCLSRCYLSGRGECLSGSRVEWKKRLGVEGIGQEKQGSLG